MSNPVKIETFIIYKTQNLTQLTLFLVTKVMVVSAGSASIDKTELISSGPSGPNSICTLKNDVPLKVYGAVGFNTPLGPAFCGGKKHREENYNKQCFIFNSDNEWIPWVDMTTPRVFAAAIQTNEHQTMLLGGFVQGVVPLKSSELIELESSLGPMDSLKLPVTFYRHCILKINATFGLITGGLQDSTSLFSAATWYLDLQSFDTTPGPRMQNRRAAHGCATLHLGSKTYGIVSGGYDNKVLDSTEFIELNEENPSWIDGKQN